MSVPRPELVFVTGPQQGEKVVLTTDRVVAGRSSACEINLKEEFASRKQFVFMLTADGWTMENLSTNGTRVNGKRYKQGKKLLLATGDVIGVGVDTRILYVAPGDDSEKAIAEYRRANNRFAGAESDRQADQVPANQPAPAGDLPPQTGLAETPADSQPAAQVKLVSTGPQRPTDYHGQTISGRAMAQAPAEVIEVPAKTPAPRKRSRRLMIIGIVGLAWTVILVVIGAIMLPGRGGGSDLQSGMPVLLMREDIAGALLEKLPRPDKPDQSKADKALKDAQDLFPRRMADRRNCYDVVKNFKTYLAYKAGEPLFPYDEQYHQYQTACQELVDDVVRVYGNAYSLERNKNWKRAEGEFDKLMDIVPERSMNDPAFTKFISNVLTHLTYIRQQSTVKK